TLPVYRGDMVNGREAHAEQRRADPQRILKGYAAARNIMRHLGWDAEVGPEIGRDQLLALCERLDPRREPGRLTLIARMGAQKVGERLP
ncbi:3-deoxy-7-phosphoheptulonate synthase, partial [Pseudomonas aeruginosa]|uniref:3-deoxy-7-phosphoheptulonate synthase n=1 Tax=Pseudomonas aeruginosa TaxID=287 RepID=UPI003BF51383